MKKLLLFLFLSTNYTIINAQMVVSAPDVTAQLTANQQVLSQQNQKLLQELQTMNATLKEKKAIAEEMRDREKRAEDALFTVPPYIKNGNEINNILDSEVVILQLIQKFKNVASNLQGVNVTSFITPLLSAMNKEVTSATKVCTDNIYRMTPEERRKYLDEINQKMSTRLHTIQNKFNELEGSIRYYNENERQKQARLNLMNKKVTPKT